MKKSPPRAQKASPKADSLRQAAGILGTTHEVLRSAKAAGCPGFVNGRVDVDQVRAWIAKHPAAASNLEMSPMQTQKFRKLKADADAKEFALAIRRGDYLPKLEVRSAIIRAVTTCRSVMSGKASGLALTLAAKTGADPVELEEQVKQANREIIAELHRMPLAQEPPTCRHCGKSEWI